MQKELIKFLKIMRLVELVRCKNVNITLQDRTKSNHCWKNAVYINTEIYNVEQRQHLFEECETTLKQGRYFQRQF